jgi:hypothetical protein
MQAALTGGLVVFCRAAHASQGSLLRDWSFGFLMLMRLYCMVYGQMVPWKVVLLSVYWMLYTVLLAAVQDVPQAAGSVS